MSIFFFSLLKTRTGLLGGLAISDKHLSSFSCLTILFVTCCSIGIGVCNSVYNWNALPPYNFCMGQVNEISEDFFKPQLIVLSVCAIMILLTILIDTYCALINCNSNGHCYQADALQVRKVKRSMAKHTLLIGSVINCFFFLLLLMFFLFSFFTDFAFKNKVALAATILNCFLALEPPLKIFFCFKRNQHNQKKSTQDHQQWELDQAYKSRALREANKSVNCSLEAGPWDVWALDLKIDTSNHDSDLTLTSSSNYDLPRWNQPAKHLPSPSPSSIPTRFTAPVDVHAPPPPTRLSVTDLSSSPIPFIDE